MAAIERVTLSKMISETACTLEGDFGLAALGLPGLRIITRSTTSSLADYAEWNVEALRDRESIITDGACS